MSFYCRHIFLLRIIWYCLNIAYNVLQLNADFVLHKICDLGAVSTSNFV
jgi:hypothetical protein